MEIVLEGWRGAWGFLDLTGSRVTTVQASSLAFGVPASVGSRLVMLPTGGATTATR